MPTYTEPSKPDVTYTDPQWTEMTFKMMGDLTFVGLGEQTFDKWFGKLSAPSYTEPSKGTVIYTEPSK